MQIFYAHTRTWDIIIIIPQQPATQATLTIINPNNHTQTTKQPHFDKIQQQQQQQQRFSTIEEQTPTPQPSS